MKKLIKLIGIAVILGYAVFLSRKYGLVLPTVSDFADCAGEIKDSLSELGKKFSFKASEQASFRSVHTLL